MKFLLLGRLLVKLASSNIFKASIKNLFLCTALHLLAASLLVTLTLSTMLFDFLLYSFCFGAVLALLLVLLRKIVLPTSALVNEILSFFLWHSPRHIVDLAHEYVSKGLFILLFNLASSHALLLLLLLALALLHILRSSLSLTTLCIFLAFLILRRLTLLFLLAEILLLIIL